MVDPIFATVVNVLVVCLVVQSLFPLGFLSRKSHCLRSLRRLEVGRIFSFQKGLIAKLSEFEGSPLLVAGSRPTVTRKNVQDAF